MARRSRLRGGLGLPGVPGKESRRPSSLESGGRAPPVARTPHLHQSARRSPAPDKSQPAKGYPIRHRREVELARTMLA
jgi:hypothetical protein